MINTIVLKIKRKETPFYAKLNTILKNARRMSVPSIPAIHLPLYHLAKNIKVMWGTFITSIWTTPVFKARCVGGEGLKIYNGMPWIGNENIRLNLGKDVTIVGKASFYAGHAGYNVPTVTVGNRVTIGYMSEFSISSTITIGDDTLIGTGCAFFDNDGHPISAERRRKHEAVNSDEILPISIGENVWLGRMVTVLKGVTIGDNSIIATGSVVTHDVPPNEIWGGVPAKLVGRVPVERYPKPIKTQEISDAV